LRRPAFVANKMHFVGPPKLGKLAVARAEHWGVRFPTNLLDSETLAANRDAHNARSDLTLTVQPLNFEAAFNAFPDRIT
jgi:hypothetical protein